MKKILVTATNYSKYCFQGKKLLEDYGCEIIENPHGRPYIYEELKELVKDIDGAVVGVDTWNDDVFKLAPKLEAIARFGVGVDNIDLEAAKTNRITVTNSPGINTSAVAEHTIGLILSLTRMIPSFNNLVRNGEWKRPMVHELKSQTIGLLGFGAIGRDVAYKLKAFGANIIAFDKYPNKEKADELGVKLVSYNELLKESDIISFHLPATLETRHLINQDAISQMKHGVLLINTARGNIIDEKALYVGLKSGKIAGMGTDVFENEPVLPTNPLFEFEQYIATPHISSETYENYSATGVVTAEALIDVFRGKEPNNKLT